ncbi:MAG: hypothetical protein J3K34DRAFT_439122 [Monoraphidium minutum]|nr:MAG: hypothetical protein J3K34DRAFT_439122 [Monoraphidium minutum]
MFGEWDVESTFTGFRAPLGPRYVRPALLEAAGAGAEEGGVGSRYAFKQRFFSTLPDTFANNARVNLGLLPEDAVIADRAFNARASANAYLGDPSAVLAADYDARVPDRLTLEFQRLAADMRPLPPRRAELYIQNIQSAELEPVYSEEDAPSAAYAAFPPPNAPGWVLSELCRQVTLGVRSAEVQDYEVATVFALVSPSRIVARQRTLLYLEPRDDLYFQARGRAVAAYDYELSYRRVAAPSGATACVETPKDVVQCI